MAAVLLVRVTMSESLPSAVGAGREEGKKEREGKRIHSSAATS